MLSGEATNNNFIVWFYPTGIRTDSITLEMSTLTITPYAVYIIIVACVTIQHNIKVWKRTKIVSGADPGPPPPKIGKKYENTKYPIVSGADPGAPPPAPNIGKNMKTRNTKKNFRCAPLTWNPGSAPVCCIIIIQVLINFTILPLLAHLFQEWQRRV